jgi:phosphatidylglycerol---prolipoprotein diacylglyceryl transferase
VLPFLHLGPLTVPTFGLLVATAMLVAFAVLHVDRRRWGLPIEAETLVGLPATAGIVGAKLYHVLENPRELVAHPASELFSQFGFAWFGGLIAGIAAFAFLARRYQIPFLRLCDVASPAAALGYGVGRIGCFLSGDGDYGIPTSLPWGMSFPNGLVPTTERVHPTPLYELAAAIVIFLILRHLGSKWFVAPAIQESAATHTRTNAGIAHKSGSLFALFLILSGVSRFLVEFIRINPKVFLGLTNAQIASLACLLLGLTLFAVKRPA